MEMVERMVRRYMKNPRCVVLPLVVPAYANIATQDILKKAVEVVLVGEFDRTRPRGQRCGEKSHQFGRRRKLWHVICNAGQAQLKISIGKVQANAKSFFDKD